MRESASLSLVISPPTPRNGLRPAEIPAPQDRTAERSTVGAMILSPEASVKAAELLTPEDFYDDSYRTVFQAIGRLAMSDTPVDTTLLLAELATASKQQEHTWMVLLADLADAVPSAANIEFYAGLVKKKSRERQTLDLSVRIQQAIAGGDQDKVQHLTEEMQSVLAQSSASPALAAAKVSIQSKDQEWPDPLAEDAYYGAAGEFTNAVAPHTEADPAAILVQKLIAFGNVVGRGPHFMIGATRHGTNLNALVVGRSSVGRKGSSWDATKAPLQLADPEWARTRIMGGLSSGEGLIYQVRDRIEKMQAKKGSGDLELVVIDEGAPEKRLLIVETEFAGTLRILEREGNSLSALLRQAWDSGSLRVLTKQAQTATDAHVSIIGHVTLDELRRYLTSTEIGNGFANRFAFFCVRRSKLLPEGGSLIMHEDDPLVRRLWDPVTNAQHVGEMKRDAAARVLWHQVYPSLTPDRTGLFATVTARAAPIVTRFSMIYALLDFSEIIREEHLRAALAVWKYSEQSARYIFGDSLGDPVADDILRALRATPEGLTRTEISTLFHKNQSGARIGQALEVLMTNNLTAVETRQTGGRPTEVYRSLSSTK